MSPQLTDKLDHLPTSPGVYLMKDVAGDVIYVGKAASLRSRVRSYFQEGADLSPRVRALVERVEDLDYIVADSEMEALVLEFNLIQRHKPRYNVRFRDDKKYPYIRIALRDRYPSMGVVRNLARDGARYFGPHASSKAMWETIRLMRRVFRLRQTLVASAKKRAGCPWRDPEKPRSRPCLDYYIRICLGPCTPGITTGREYDRAVRDCVLFLDGKHEILLGRLKQEMEKASADLRFEAAARLRDKVGAVERATAEQRAVLPRREDLDVLGAAMQEDAACLALLQVREGRLINQEQHFLAGVSGLPEAEVVNEFVKLYYQKAASVPARVLLPVAIAEGEALGAWLSSLRGRKAELLVPRRGPLRELIAMAAENAAHQLRASLAREGEERRRAREAIAELQRLLRLPVPPERIECFDISNLFGRQAVGSMVVFEQGLPRRAEYRRFKIRLAGDKPDDFAMMKEVLARRLAAAVSGNVKFEKLPDLLLVDGGPGQLAMATGAMQELGMTIPAAALAKEHELLYLPGRPAPVALPAHSVSLHLFQRLRDEAHRFALAYHRRLREVEARESVLDAIPGIGPARRRALLSHFHSLAQLKASSVAEIAAVPGIGKKAAQALLDFLRQYQDL
jgi:excinuclease ABC subunit C